MKFAALFTFLTLSMSFNMAYAGEAEDNLAYCNEQVQLAGIEEMDEKTEYIKDCMDSFGPAANDNQQTND